MPYLTKLIDKHQIGKTPQGTKHPIKGAISNVEIASYQQLAEVIKGLTAHECFTVGLFPDKNQYVPAKNLQDLQKPSYTTRTAASASPGYFLVIDCDFPEFHHLKGKGLHDFLCKYLPDIFEGSGYVCTNSSSFYLKGKQAFHQWYIFEHPTDLHQLIILIDKLFKHHNILTTSLASNYSRTYVKTPIDGKLHELQQPIFEASTNRLQILNSNLPLDIEVKTGSFISAKTLSLPTIDTSLAEENTQRVHKARETEREQLLEAYMRDRGITEHSRVKDLERGNLPASLSLLSADREETSVLNEVLGFIGEGKQITELFQAVGEPGYAAHQTAKLMVDNPFNLGSYRMVDQAHGGTIYHITYDYEELDHIFQSATIKNIRAVDALKLLEAKNSLSMTEADLLAGIHSKLFGITKAKVATKLLLEDSTDHISLDSEGDAELALGDLHTIVAALERSKVSYSRADKARIENLIELDHVFNASNIKLVRDTVHGLGRTDIMAEPGPKHEFLIAPRSQLVKHLAPLYPPTNISPHADERALDALIEKYTATNKVEDISYKASLHGEKMFFGDGKVEITYQQAKPTWRNVPTVFKTLLDEMSPSMISEFRDMYINQSLGYLWPTISELVYIKKVFPQLKSDFLWINFVSNAGKTFNMDMANTIAPYEKTHLDQLLEQAAKVNPASIAKSSFLFHDEVKSFKHNWNELGAHHAIKGMYSTSSTMAQLPLKILTSAENVMTKGTQQQLNRLMIINDKSKPFADLNIDPRYEAHLAAVSHQVIYEAFTDSYNKYASKPEHKALEMATLNGKAFSTRLRPKDMLVTEDYVKELMTDFLIQELLGIDELGVKVINASWSSTSLSRYLKRVVLKDRTLFINFKKIDAPAFIEYILKETTSSLESRSMNYEALSMEWVKDLGCYKQTKPRTIANESFYGIILEIELESLRA